jgi:hypothetical protein
MKSHEKTEILECEYLEEKKPYRGNTFKFLKDTSFLFDICKEEKHKNYPIVFCYEKIYKKSKMFIRGSYSLESYFRIEILWLYSDFFFNNCLTSYDKNREAYFLEKDKNKKCINPISILNFDYIFGNIL